MGISNINIAEQIKKTGLKLTTQRIKILEAIYYLKNHPYAEDIIKHIQADNPAISQGTIYKTLDTFVEKGIIGKVETSGGTFRYDGITKMHHHLQEEGNSRIEDYFDEDLNQLLVNYFSSKNIPGFKVQDVKLHIKGKFKT